MVAEIGEGSGEIGMKYKLLRKTPQPTVTNEELNEIIKLLIANEYMIDVHIRNWGKGYWARIYKNASYKGKRESYYSGYSDSKSINEAIAKAAKKIPTV